MIVSIDEKILDLKPQKESSEISEEMEMIIYPISIDGRVVLECNKNMLITQELNNKTIKEAVVMIDKSCEQVRAISHNLVPPALENFDLESGISDYCINMNNAHQSKITFDYLGDTMNLPKLVEINIFRITQELVAISIKHEEATEINVQLSFRNNTIQLAVDDNGKGFDVLNVKPIGIGLSNIKNRVAFLNGEIDFVSSKKGTSVNILIDTSKINHD